MRTSLFIAAMLGAACVTPPADPSVLLTEEELTVGGARVGLLKDVVRFDYLNVPALEAQLRGRVRTAPTFNPCGAITAPAATRFAVLKRVLFTCHAAGLAPLGLRPTAIGPVCPVGFLDPFKPGAVEGALTPAALSLHSTQLPNLDGLKVERSGGWAAALNSPLAAAIGAGVRPSTVRLAVDDGVPLGDLLEVVEQLRAVGLTVDVGPASD